MDQVFQKTAELAEAILASVQWRDLQDAQEAFKRDPEAEALVKTAKERQNGIAKLQQLPDPDPMALKQLSDSLDEVQEKLEALDATKRLRAAQLALNQLIEQVNQVLQFIVTGQTETSGCGGNCSGCAGCR